MKVQRSANSLLVLFVVAVSAIAQKLEKTLTLDKSRLRPGHLTGCDRVLWPMTTKGYIEKWHRRKGEPQ